MTTPKGIGHSKIKKNKILWGIKVSEELCGLGE